MKIMVVDDNVDARQLLCALLERLGNEVAGAEDGRTAIVMARKIRPEAVILDISMPDMDGYALATSLRQECGLHSARLIALSGKSADEEACEAAGIDHYVMKPIRARELMEILNQPIAR